MLHFDFFILLELIILHGVAESLICSELFFDHALEDAIMRELLLELLQLLTDLPSISWLRQLFHALCVELGLRLLGEDCLLPLPLFKFLSGLFIIDILLNDRHAVLRTVDFVG